MSCVQLENGWVQVRGDAASAPYFWNPTTGETRWTLPDKEDEKEAAVAQSEAAPLKQPRAHRPRSPRPLPPIPSADGHERRDADGASGVGGAASQPDRTPPPKHPRSRSRGRSVDAQIAEDQELAFAQRPKSFSDGARTEALQQPLPPPLPPKLPRSALLSRNPDRLSALSSGEQDAEHGGGVWVQQADGQQGVKPQKHPRKRVSQPDFLGNDGLVPGDPFPPADVLLPCSTPGFAATTESLASWNSQGSTDDSGLLGAIQPAQTAQITEQKPQKHPRQNRRSSTQPIRENTFDDGNGAPQSANASLGDAAPPREVSPPPKQPRSHRPTSPVDHRGSSGRATYVESSEVYAPAARPEEPPEEYLPQRPFGQCFRTTLEHIKCQQVAGYEGPIPSVLVFLGEELRRLGGLRCRGIFRLAPNQDELLYIKSLLQSESTELDLRGSFDDPNIAATLIKVWFREMPVRLLSVIRPEKLIQASEGALDPLEVINTEYPEPYRSLFLWLIDTLAGVVANEQTTLMSSQNIGIVMTPNLFDPTKVPCTAASGAF
uniref:Rho-GAP domain-containing protein n=1 Tax=Pinguiococcus pyrenoidosus TaxID=172671 RepID=A0A7R9UBW6_9STRA|mmetsp:Transcript_4850/g.19422  ORF Transcript_4850/g.19422 Transcript_4850/m.19422 type:complete len:547 (+) Transcript_4850:112-1752(+)